MYPHTDLSLGRQQLPGLSSQRTLCDQTYSYWSQLLSLLDCIHICLHCSSHDMLQIQAAETRRRCRIYVLHYILHLYGNDDVEQQSISLGVPRLLWSRACMQSERSHCGSSIQCSSRSHVSFIRIPFHRYDILRTHTMPVLPLVD